MRPAGEAQPSELSSPGKYARKTGAEVGSELSLALLTSIREAVASRPSSIPIIKVLKLPQPAYTAPMSCAAAARKQFHLLNSALKCIVQGLHRLTIGYNLSNLLRTDMLVSAGAR